MNITDIQLSAIKEAPFNYNLHPDNQLDQLINSLKEFGQFKNVVIWKGYCIAGNGLVFAARKIGWKAIKGVYRDDLTENQAKRLCVADNAMPYLADPDSKKLEDLLKSLPSFDDIPGVDENWLGTFDLSLEVVDEIDFPDLPDGDKKPFQQITFTLADIQADEIKGALEIAKKNIKIKTFGNENSNGNALYRIIKEWVEQKI